MAFNVNNFRSALPGGGARANLFEVRIPSPPGLDGLPDDASRKVRLLCQTASIPTGTIEQTELNYFGRVYKIAGTRTFEDWETTILNDEDFAIRIWMEKWMDKINGNTSNVASEAALNPNNYMVDAQVIQYGKNGDPIREYAMLGCWPTAIAAIELDWSTNNEVVNFAITWAYSSWESVDIEEKAFGFSGEIKLPVFGTISI